jgi:hypothetical protein
MERSTSIYDYITRRMTHLELVSAVKSLILYLEFSSSNIVKYVAFRFYRIDFIPWKLSGSLLLIYHEYRPYRKRFGKTLLVYVLI